MSMPTAPQPPVEQAQALISDGTVKGGMVAKMESAFEALASNVPRVHIIQWQGPETLSNMIKRQFNSGTVIHSK
jgi:acetylglutamate kinase